MTRKQSTGRTKSPTVKPTEAVMMDIHRLLEGQEFHGLDDVSAFLQRAFASGDRSRPAARSSLQRAQDLMYRAWEQRSRARRVALARKALETSADCADAYVLLAEEAATPEEACGLFAEGHQAGERVLGRAAFRDHAGYFWGLVETRPYMRARLGLATCLFQLGRHEEAVAHYRELLRLNPGDNQGVRYLLASALCELRRDDELLALLDGPEYGEDASAAWQYTRALVLYRQGTDSAAARKALAKAWRGNPHVPAYLTGERKVPKRLPEYMGFGDESEAIVYAAESRHLWESTPGALAWLGKRPKRNTVRPR